MRNSTVLHMCGTLFRACRQLSCLLFAGKSSRIGRRICVCAVRSLFVEDRQHHIVLIGPTPTYIGPPNPSIMHHVVAASNLMSKAYSPPRRQHRCKICTTQCPFYIQAGCACDYCCGVREDLCMAMIWNEIIAAKCCICNRSRRRSHKYRKCTFVPRKEKARYSPRND